MKTKRQRVEIKCDNCMNCIENSSYKDYIEQKGDDGSKSSKILISQALDLILDRAHIHQEHDKGENNVQFCEDCNKLFSDLYKIFIKFIDRCRKDSIIFKKYGSPTWLKCITSFRKKKSEFDNAFSPPETNDILVSEIDIKEEIVELDESNSLVDSCPFNSEVFEADDDDDELFKDCAITPDPDAVKNEEIKIEVNPVEKRKRGRPSIKSAKVSKSKKKIEKVKKLKAKTKSKQSSKNTKSRKNCPKTEIDENIETDLPSSEINDSSDCNDKDGQDKEQSSSAVRKSGRQNSSTKSRNSKVSFNDDENIEIDIPSPEIKDSSGCKDKDGQDKEHSSAAVSPRPLRKCKKSKISLDHDDDENNEDAGIPSPERNNSPNSDCKVKVGVKKRSHKKLPASAVRRPSGKRPKIEFEKNGNLFKCPEPGCEKEAKTRWNLRLHIKCVHDKNFEFQCHSCSKKFFTKTALTIHARRFHPEDEEQQGQIINAYICKEPGCSKRFGYPATLATHLLSHKPRTEHPFACTTCSKKFKRTSDLKDHMTVHTNERRFTCHFCGSSFKTNKNLCKHVGEQHDDKKKTIICEICGKSLKNAGNLRIHIRNVHEGHKDYKCLLCSRAFTSQSCLRAHNTSKHSDAFVKLSDNPEEQTKLDTTLQESSDLQTIDIPVVNDTNIVTVSSDSPFTELMTFFP